MNIEIGPLQGRFEIKFDELEEKFVFEIIPFDTIREIAERSVDYRLRKLEEMRKPKGLGLKVNERKIEALIEEIEGMGGFDINEGFNWTDW